MYAVYHGPERLRGIAQRVHNGAHYLAEGEALNALEKFIHAFPFSLWHRHHHRHAGVQEAGHGLLNEHFFDTLHISPKTAEELQNIKSRAAEKEINLRYFEDGTVSAPSLPLTPSLHLNHHHCHLTLSLHLHHQVIHLLPDTCIFSRLESHWTKQPRTRTSTTSSAFLAATGQLSVEFPMLL